MPTRTLRALARFAVLGALACGGDDDDRVEYRELQIDVSTPATLFGQAAFLGPPIEAPYPDDTLSVVAYAESAGPAGATLLIPEIARPDGAPLFPAMTRFSEFLT